MYASVGSRAHSAREHRQRLEGCDHLRAQQRQPLAHQHEVRVVGDERTRRAEMNERTRRGCDSRERLHVRHHIVPEPPLELAGGREVDVVEVRPHL